jgi:hypothetical protein
VRVVGAVPTGTGTTETDRRENNMTDSGCARVNGQMWACGLYIDGAFGTVHAWQTLLDIVECAGITVDREDLAALDPDLWDEVMDELTDELELVTDGGYWEWEAGDLTLLADEESA